MFTRLDELQLQKAIRLSELPLVGKSKVCTKALAGNLRLQKHLVISVQGLTAMKGALEGKRRQR